MKIRIDANNIKFRLSKTEIETLKSSGGLTEEIDLGNNQKLTYTVEIDSNVEKPKLSFSSCSIACSIPDQIAQKWLGTNQVGIRENMLKADGMSLNLVVEEDLPPRKGKKKLN